MIHVRKDDILKTDAEALVNTVNCVGVMGRGVALQFKKAYPNNFKAYERACKNNEVKVGQMFVYETGQLTPRYIINFPTKQHWKGKSKIEFIQSGMKSLVQEIKKHNIRSIAIPPLGCGLGGLDWKQVKPVIEKALADIPDVQVHIFEPNNILKEDSILKEDVVPELNPNRAALLGLISRYLSGLMDPFITVLEIQKLLYFMQVAGQSTLKLRYEKFKYGPYAPNLRFVLQKLEGYYIQGYKNDGDDPNNVLELIGDADREAMRILAQEVDVLSRFERVAELVEGFETPSGMELLATVHWVVTQEGASDIATTIEKIHNWNSRKKSFEPRQIEIAYNILNSKGWLTSSITV